MQEKIWYNDGENINQLKEGEFMLTYDDIIYFYNDKKNIVDYEPQEDDCQKLAKTFFTGCGKKDDCRYSAEIKRRMMERKLTELTTFKYFTEDEAFELVLSGFIPKRRENKMVINPSQKWHLYVSYFAYQEAGYNLNINSGITKVSGDDFVKTPFPFGKKVRQKEYEKWLKRAAGCVQKDSWENVENNIKKNISFRL